MKRLIRSTFWPNFIPNGTCCAILNRVLRWKNGEIWRKMAKWRNDDVINRLKMALWIFFSTTGQSQYLEDHFAKNCMSIARSVEKKKEIGEKSTKMSSYSINIYMPVDFKKPGALIFCSPLRTGSLRYFGRLIYELQNLIQYKCSTSVEAEFHCASISAISFFMPSTGWQTTSDL